ncbi:M48 family metalloprotease [bacterium]|nr:M48 family metalloprotease [bacterium]
MSSEARALMCPRCEGTELEAAMTEQGVEIDYCPACGGMWMDKGEIYQFAKRSRPLSGDIIEAQRKAKPSELASPATGNPMQELRLFGENVRIDMCPDTEGIWLDRGELEQVMELSEAGFRVTLDESVNAAPDEDEGDPEVRLASLAAAMRPMPNLIVRSGGVLFLLLALLGAVLIALVEMEVLLPWVAVAVGCGIALLQYLIGPFIMDLSLRWFYKCHWADADRDLPAHLRDFVKELSGKQNIRFPRFGIIEDGAPNAFTYGHRPGNARIVLTRGIFELLDPGEVEAVTAHEIGHAVHWDMVVMTIANMVPMLAYFAYRTLISVRSSGRDKSRGARIAIAVGAYVVYIVSQYIVLWLSRVREYHADRFAGDATGRPNDLASALVKIGYGLAGRRGESAKELQADADAGRRRTPSLEAIGAFGIFDSKAARHLAVASAPAAKGGVDPVHIKNAMRWELWNPWAKFYELNSTHPLIANRMDYLGRQAASKGEEPFVVFDLRKPESYWDDFLTDAFVMFLPSLLLVGLLTAGVLMEKPLLMALAALGLGLGMFVKTIYSYRVGFFPETTVAGLLKNVKVSAIRGVPCTLKGKVIGRGVPGLIWSDDFVVQDETGIMFLDYRQPLRILEFFFGLLRRGKLDNADVVAEGWYRRCPTPYIELKSITTGGKTRRCYLYWAKLVVAALVSVGGLYLVMRALGA